MKIFRFVIAGILAFSLAAGASAQGLYYQSTLIYAKSNLAATAQTVSTARVNLTGYNISNPTTVTVYVQFFDAKIADVTVGATAPTFWLAIPANGVTDGGWPAAVRFANGIVVAVTTTPTGSTAPASSIPIVLFYAN